jgi:hypothetical protein
MTVGRAALLAQLEDGHAGTVHLYCLVELEDVLLQLLQYYSSM